MSELEGFFDALVGEGTADARGLSFTLESEKARQKLQEFALTHPEHFQLLALAGMFALGARQLELRSDSDDFVLETDLELARAPFTDLWAKASGGHSGERLLALCFLTSARLDEVDWTVTSRDASGGWSYRLRCRKGELGQSELKSSEHQHAGTRIAAKRKALGQVALRFFSRVKDRLRQRYAADEQLVRDHIFLDHDSTLTYNGRPLEPSGLGGGKALAVLESGEAPKLVNSDLVHRAKSGRTVVVLLCEPGSEHSPYLPGQHGHLVWIWNGLAMDSIWLGNEFAFFRVFAWAPRLQPDLSLTQLVSNREKDAFEREVKTLARELLGVYVKQLAERIRNDGDPNRAKYYDSELEVVKRALRTRISLSRSRARLASLNRTLIACPVLIGSDEQANRRWWSFEDIWKECEAKRPVAAWADDFGGKVPACPGRPVVLETDTQGWRFLQSLLPKWALIEGQTVMMQVDIVSFGGGLSEEAKADFEGQFTHQGHQYRWTFSKNVTNSTLIAPGAKQSRALRPWSDAPQGLRVRTDWSPEVTYSGRLVDEQLASDLRDRLVVGLAQALSETPGECSEQRFKVAIEKLFRALRKASVPAEVLQLPWLFAHTAKDGLGRFSPQQLKARLESFDAPCFFSPEPPITPQDLPPAWAELPIVWSASKHHRVLGELVGLPVFEVTSWWSKLTSRTTTPERILWAQKLSGPSCPAGIEALELRVCEWGALAKGTAHRRDWREGVQLGVSRGPWIYPGISIDIHWSQGWPGCEGTQWGLGGENGESALRGAVLPLAAIFLAEAPAEILLKTSPDLLASWLFDLLSEPSNHDQAVLLSASGEKLRWSDLGPEAHYFQDPVGFKSALPGAVYLPGELMSTVELLEPPRRWHRYASPPIPPLSVGKPSPPAPPRSKAPTPAPELQAPPAPSAPAADSAPSALAADPVPSAPAADPAQQRALPPAEAVSSTPLNLFETAPDVPLGELALSSPQDHDIAGLAELRQEAAELVPPAHRAGFSRYLEDLTVEPTLPDILALWDGRPVLGPKGLALCADRGSRAYLHSALFSVFNRVRSEVKESDEREFHLSLIAWLQGQTSTPKL